MLGLDFTVDRPAELRSHLRALGRRYLAAADPGEGGDATPAIEELREPTPLPSQGSEVSYEAS